MTRYITLGSDNISLFEDGQQPRGPMIFRRFGTTLLAKLLGGEVAGVTSIVVPGPGRSFDDRSLLIKEDVDDKDGFAVHSFANDDQHICRELVFAVTEASTYRSTGSEAYGSLSAASSRANQPALKRAMELWSETASPEGTLVEYYLRKRGLKLPADSVGSISNDSIRFHPACPLGPNELRPCMVGLYRHINTDMPTGILLTALSEKGDKISRKALGPAFFSAIKLTRSYVSDGSLAIAESLE